MRAEKDLAVLVKNTETRSVGANRDVIIGTDDVLEVGKKLVINATDEIVLKSGDATLSLVKNGDILLNGKNLSLTGSGKITLKASSDLVVKGATIADN